MRARCAAAGLLAVIAIELSTPALAQTLPSQIIVVVPYAAGGSTDAFARLVTPYLAERLGSRIVIENRSGGAGSIGAKRVIQSPPDGATVLLTTATLAVNDISQKKGFSNDELRTVAIVASSPDILTLHPSNPAKSLDDLVHNAKDGKSITMSSGGVGTTPWIVAEYFFQEVGKVKAVHVPFAGGGPAIAAAIGNHVDVFAGNVATAAAPISQGQLRGIVLGAAARSPLAPDVPTFAEVGYPNFSPLNWIGLFVPLKTPEPIVVKLNAEINAVLKEPEVQRKLVAGGFRPHDPIASRSRGHVQARHHQLGQDVPRHRLSAGLNLARSLRFSPRKAGQSHLVAVQP